MIVSQSTLLSRHEGLLKQKQFVWIILYMHYDNYNVSQYSKIPFWEKQNCNFLLACSENHFKAHGINDYCYPYEIHESEEFGR